MRRSVRVILGWPLVLAAASLAGLVLGRTGDGLPDISSWLLLGSLPVVIAAQWTRRGRSPSPLTGQPKS